MQNSSINIQNYEAFIVNYLDQVSSPVETAELFLFLEMHPELGEDPDELRNMTLKPEPGIHYDFKEALKLNHDVDAGEISLGNFIYYFTAFVEGDLSRKGMETVEDFARLHPELKNELALLEQCKAIAPIELVYPNKAELKRNSGTLVPIWLRWIAVAASVLILFTIYLRLEPTTTQSVNQRLTKVETPLKDNPPSSKEKTEKSLNNKTSIDQAIEKPANKASIRGEKKKQLPTEVRDVNNNVKPIRTMPTLPNTMNYTHGFDGTSRQTYSDLYDDIRLSQELMLSYAEHHAESVQSTEEIPVLNMGRRFNQYLQSGAQMASQVSESFNGWMLADIGIRGFNLLTDNEVELMREVGQDGNTGNVKLKDGNATYLLKKSRL
jgi:hypothetical protein